MKRILSLVVMGLLAACASEQPKYDKLRTADQALKEYDQNQIKDGMAITKKGAVVDIKTEEVQALRNRLQFELDEKDKKVQLLEEKLKASEEDLMQARISLGLPGQKPKQLGKCCTSDGKLIPGTIKQAPTLAEELAQLKKRKPNTQETTTATENENQASDHSEEN